MPDLRLPHLASRLQGYGTTIFAEMTALAVKHNAINLGQGFPDFEGAGRDPRRGDRGDPGGQESVLPQLWDP